MDVHNHQEPFAFSGQREPERDSYWLDRQELVELVRLGPLISIDLIPRGPDGRILTGLRNNEPARGSWFVPGGRINKGESLDRAFRRICRSELGLQIEREDSVFMGVFEHFYSSNFAQTPDMGTHYVVLAHLIDLQDEHQISPDDQHLEWRWFDLDELATEKTVHRNTKAYAKLQYPPRP